MRFSLLQRNPASRAVSGATIGNSSAPAGAVNGWCRLFFLTALLIAGSPTAPAQSPGTAPPEGVFNRDDGEDAAGLPIDAFFFLSDSGNQVMMPGLSWEEIERLIDREAGMEADQQKFSYQALEIQGSTEQTRAEMEVVLRLTIEPTEGRWVAIPLRMGNFHRLAPPDVSGVDEYFMTLGRGGEGYLLFVKADSRRDAMLRMRVSARVESTSAARSLAFQLPDVPAKVELTVDAENVSGEVVGRGDESITPQSVAGPSSGYLVESGGGSFSIRWGRLERSIDKVPLLEVESRVSVRWDSPEDQPIASVQLTIRNIHGSINSFQLRLPTGAVVLEPPRLGANGQSIELVTAKTERDVEVREVVIPPEERQQRIDLNFDLQLANDSASADSPLGFRVPEVVGALRHRGEIEIQTGGDYRLRWRSRSWLRGELGESREDGSSGRFYRFRYDRASFDLPELQLWLGEKERQMRMVSQSQITVGQSTANLVMTIEVNGQTSDGRLHLDEASWRISSIEDVETGEALDSYTSESYRVIEFNANGSGQPTPIRVRAERGLEPADGQVRFALPRVLEIDEAALVQSATVSIVNSGRTVLVVDLGASQGLSRVVPSNIEKSSGSTVDTFRVSAQETPAIVVGTMIDQPPRINLDCAAAIELDGGQLRTTVDWTVSSTLELEGRLPVRIPKLQPFAAAPTPLADDGTEGFDDTGLQLDEDLPDDLADLSSDWVVTVNDIPATLQRRGPDDDHYVLISPQLAMGSMAIRWRSVRRWRFGVTDGAIESVSLPRPDFADVTVRGAIRVELQGNGQLDMVAVDSPTVSDLELVTLPRDPIRLKLQSRRTRREELSIRQTVLRTVVGHNTRYERVLATIQGGDSFRVGLPEAAREVSVEAFIDGQTVTNVRRDRDSLIVALRGDEASHVIDLRVWIAAKTSSSVATVEPMLKLPFGAGRVFWQIVTPTDAHVVWASPTLGRSMAWRFDHWKLYREPSHSDQALMAMAGSAVNLVPDGNPYLYVGSDLRSFKVIIVSRAVLWMCVGSIVLVISMILMNFPQTRHPLAAIVAAILLGGLLAIAPDAAVLAGQVGIIALVLVIVMIAIRALTSPNGSDRVFASSATPPASTPPSTRSRKTPEPQATMGVSTTQTLPPPPSPSEAPS